ncbi:MAG TPA: TraR/DksA C4-type zinc finger protein [Candidatus Paceibacterota bacterium]|nr:TraR/DksA C4-type zinc finger protein [Candidatus Paceibacterota bacterium]
MTIDTARFKSVLEKELALVEKELLSVARRNPDSPTDWEAKPADYDTPPGDDTVDQADVVEEFGNNAGIVKQLEIRYNEIKDALRRLEEGTYGVCRVCNAPIEEARLEANPAAATCLAHKEA